MRFRDREDGASDLIYTYSIKLRPKWLGGLFDPIAGVLFACETRRRFKAMSDIWTCGAFSMRGRRLASPATSHQSRDAGLPMDGRGTIAAGRGGRIAASG